MGHNQPERDLILSPQHRLSLSSNIIGRIRGEHQLIMAHGCLGETLFTGPQALRMIPAESRRELHALFPNIDMETTPVSPHLRGRPLDKVIARHQDHSRDFIH